MTECDLENILTPTHKLPSFDTCDLLHVQENVPIEAFEMMYLRNVYGKLSFENMKRIEVQREPFFYGSSRPHAIAKFSLAYAGSVVLPPTYVAMNFDNDDECAVVCVDVRTGRSFDLLAIPPTCKNDGHVGRHDFRSYASKCRICRYNAENGYVLSCRHTACVPCLFRFQHCPTCGGVSDVICRISLQRKLALKKGDVVRQPCGHVSLNRNSVCEVCKLKSAHFHELE